MGSDADGGGAGGGDRDGESPNEQQHAMLSDNESSFEMHSEESEEEGNFFDDAPAHNDPTFLEGEDVVLGVGEDDLPGTGSGPEDEMLGEDEDVSSVSDGGADSVVEEEVVVLSDSDEEEVVVSGGGGPQPPASSIGGHQGASSSGPDLQGAAAQNAGAPAISYTQRRNPGLQIDVGSSSNGVGGGLGGAASSSAVLPPGVVRGVVSGESSPARGDPSPTGFFGAFRSAFAPISGLFARAFKRPRPPSGGAGEGGGASGVGAGGGPRVEETVYEDAREEPSSEEPSPKRRRSEGTARSSGLGHQREDLFVPPQNDQINSSSTRAIMPTAQSSSGAPSSSHPFLGDSSDGLGGVLSPKDRVPLPGVHPSSSSLLPHASAHGHTTKASAPKSRLRNILDSDEDESPPPSPASYNLAKNNGAVEEQAANNLLDRDPAGRAGGRASTLNNNLDQHQSSSSALRQRPKIGPTSPLVAARRLSGQSGGENESIGILMQHASQQGQFLPAKREFRKTDTLDAIYSWAEELLDAGVEQVGRHLLVGRGAAGRGRGAGRFSWLGK